LPRGSVDGAAPVMTDPDLPHQIVLNFCPNGIYISCNCLAMRAVTGKVVQWQLIEVRKRWETADAVAAYRAWHEAQGIGLEEL
jgi:hypothetical protein